MCRGNDKQPYRKIGEERDTEYIHTRETLNLPIFTPAYLSHFRTLWQVIVNLFRNE